MTVEEIRDISIDSASVYYNYLEQNEKGFSEVDVYELVYLEDVELLIKLRLSAKLFDLESLFFKNLRNGIKYDASQVRVVEYDDDKNILLIRPANDLKDDFKELRKEDIKIISDLKFLVQRVKEWYELNGAKISIPEKVSCLNNRIGSFEFISGYQPSQNQIQSLENIFTNPFSYVWGPPGTGKTRFVLSYAVLHYLNNNKKVAILAPTNNSIEQVLRGVIEMTDLAGIDRKEIIRLGAPTKKFAEEFPEVCEEKGIQKKLQQIDRQISILERVINYKSSIESLSKKERNLKLLDELGILNSEREKIKNDFAVQERKLKEIELDVKYKSSEIKRLNDEFYNKEKREKTIAYKIARVFPHFSKSIESQKHEIQSKITKASKEFDLHIYDQEKLGNKLKTIKEKLDQSNAHVDDKVSELKNIYGETIVNKFNSILSEKNIDVLKKDIATELERERVAMKIDSHIIEEYNYFPVEQIEYDLIEYKKSRDELSLHSTEERLKDVKVIACTLDGYIGRYAESKLDVDHIFVDEAGYANIVKTLTLFNHDVPITLLGDHMQLPPVCEINDSEIDRDIIYTNMFLWSQSSVYIDHLFFHDRDTCLRQYRNNTTYKSVSMKTTTLNTTYRFAANLARVLSSYVYNDPIESANSTDATKIIFINAKKTEGPKSRVSYNEVEAIVSYLGRVKPKDFVIITPYRNQLKLLNRRLPKERNEQKILTVHGSQGREWDTVILSVVDTFDKFFVDTTSTVSRGLNLINTAISRAKKNLIIVCDRSYWIEQNDQLISELIKNGEEIIL
ncbi:MAG: AAA domain-containing protein [Tissierellia bacterium]|nr:AAA domain-containing protein [Tissierellia bacterium]